MHTTTQQQRNADNWTDEVCRDDGARRNNRNPPSVASRLTRGRHGSVAQVGVRRSARDQRQTAVFTHRRRDTTATTPYGRAKARET